MKPILFNSITHCDQCSSDLKYALIIACNGCDYHTSVHLHKTCQRCLHLWLEYGMEESKKIRKKRRIQQTKRLKEKNRDILDNLERGYFDNEPQIKMMLSRQYINSTRLPLLRIVPVSIAAIYIIVTLIK